MIDIYFSDDTGFKIEAWDKYEIKDNIFYIYHGENTKIIPLANVFEIDIENDIKYLKTNKESKENKSK